MILEISQVWSFADECKQTRNSYNIFRSFGGIKDQITVYIHYVTIITLFIHICIHWSIVIHHFTDLFIHCRELQITSVTW